MLYEPVTVFDRETLAQVFEDAHGVPAEGPDFERVYVKALARAGHVLDGAGYAHDSLIACNEGCDVATCHHGVDFGRLRVAAGYSDSSLAECMLERAEVAVDGRLLLTYGADWPTTVTVWPIPEAAARAIECLTDECLLDYHYVPGTIIPRLEPLDVSEYDLGDAAEVEYADFILGLVQGARVGNEN